MKHVRYILRRHEVDIPDLPDGQAINGNNVTNGAPSPEEWFLSGPTGNGRLGVFIFNKISRRHIDHLLEAMASARGVDIRILNCGGGDGWAVDALCIELDRIGRSNVTTEVIEHAASAALNLLCSSGTVRAHLGSTFTIHAGVTEVRRGSGLSADEILDLVEQGHQSNLDNLALRMADPGLYLRGDFDHKIDARAALRIGLIDGIIS